VPGRPAARGEARGIPLDVAWRDLAEEQRRWVIEGDGRKGRKHWYGVKHFFAWLETKAYKMHIRVLLSRYRAYTPCAACHGARLKPESLLWRSARGNSPARADAAADRRLPRVLRQLRCPRRWTRPTDLLLGEIRTRLAYLCEVGLGYLTLDRQSRTLSGGEVQRINLTTALGTSLVNTLFVLDEPSIGLHPRDMGRVIGVMRRLRDAGNSLVVVEHDPQIMLEADRLLDMGPGPASAAARWCSSARRADHAREGEDADGGVPLRSQAARRRRPSPPSHRHSGGEGRGRSKCSAPAEHNLQSQTSNCRWAAWSASPASPARASRRWCRTCCTPRCASISGKPTEAPANIAPWRGANISEVVMVDQTPIGKHHALQPGQLRRRLRPDPRAVREAAEVSKERGYTPGTFSFNSGTGRCPTCGGNGFEHVEMQFLSDVYLRCPDCNGSRFRAEVLELKIEGAGRRLKSSPRCWSSPWPRHWVLRGASRRAARLAPLADVGLDYLRLGQPVPTLSGGEAQRLKLAGYLADTGTAGQASCSSSTSRPRACTSTTSPSC
jgi:excinuclease ABC subunit A